MRWAGHARERPYTVYTGLRARCGASAGAGQSAYLQYQCVHRKSFPVLSRAPARAARRRAQPSASTAYAHAKRARYRARSRDATLTQIRNWRFSALGFLRRTDGPRPHDKPFLLLTVSRVFSRAARLPSARLRGQPADPVNTTQHTHFSRSRIHTVWPAPPAFHAIVCVHRRTGRGASRPPGARLNMQQ